MINIKNNFKRTKSRKTKTNLSQIMWTIVRFVILAGIVYYILYPILLKLSLAFMEEGDLYDVTVQMIPRNFTLDNFIKVFKYLEYPKAALGSLFIVLLTSATQLIACTLTGYGFARFEFPGKKLMFALVMLALIIPPQTIIIPMFLNYRFFDPLKIFTLFTGSSVSLVNTVWSVVLTGITCMGLKNGLYIYLARQTFRNLPKELEEAALIDGSGFFGTFIRVMLPSARSILVVIFLFSAVWQWTDIFYTGWFLPQMDTLSFRLNTLLNVVMTKEGITQGLDTYYANQMNATGCLLMIIPLVILYIFVQRQFIEGIERSGIVG